MPADIDPIITQLHSLQHDLDTLRADRQHFAPVPVDSPVYLDCPDSPGWWWGYSENRLFGPQSPHFFPAYVKQFGDDFVIQIFGKTTMAWASRLQTDEDMMSLPLKGSRWIKATPPGHTSTL